MEGDGQCVLALLGRNLLVVLNLFFVPAPFRKSNMAIRGQKRNQNRINPIHLAKIRNTAALIRELFDGDGTYRRSSQE